MDFKKDVSRHDMVRELLQMERQVLLEAFQGESKYTKRHLIKMLMDALVDNGGSRPYYIQVKRMAKSLVDVM